MASEDAAQLKGQLEAALARAGDAESERDFLAAKLQTVRWALEDLMGKLGN